MQPLTRFLLLLILLLPHPSQGEEIGYALTLSERAVTDEKFMGITLHGALLLRGHAALAELSDLAWDEDENLLYGVTDRGILLHLLPLIENNRLIGLQLLRHYKLRDRNGSALQQAMADAEGLALEGSNNGRKGDSLLAVSFELHNRVDFYSPMGEYQRSLKLPDQLRNPLFYRDPNNGLEALARHPEFGYMTGPERVKANGTLPIFSQEGSVWYYQPQEPHGALVALEALDDGTLLILERSFSSLFEPLVITLLQAHPTAGNAGSLLPTRLLVRFDSTEGWRTQNLEGLTHHRGKYFFMVSDDGGASFLQTQLIYFEIP